MKATSTAAGIILLTIVAVTVTFYVDRPEERWLALLIGTPVAVLVGASLWLGGRRS